MPKRQEEAAMDHPDSGLWRGPAAAVPARAAVPVGLPDPLPRLARALGPGPFAQVFLFASPEADLAALAAAAPAVFGPARVCGCSTSGEITGRGYDSGQIVAFALPAAGFEVEQLLIEPLDALDPRALISDLLRARQALGRRAPDWPHEAAVLLIDGLSGQEDALVAALSGGLGAVPVVGGSAGDGARFRTAPVFARGQLRENAAVLTLIRSAWELRPFCFAHQRPTARRMVVTRADPSRRLVARINDEPAAREYARALGRLPEQLTPFLFAAHPLLVRAGGRHHVRSIQQVEPDGGLTFFAAIDEGLVLTLAEPVDMVAHLRAEMAGLCAGGRPSVILAFDCFFRRLEAEGRQLGREISELLMQNGVWGLSTYGEQVGAMHVNQTLTGLAFYPPEVRR
ncbi:FIST N-terminal domain-containing protein [Rhodobacter capsulatus]|uniref:FIST N-terminal domain-containing protein n=2 Tax=Rhodobacter capsulatus TaxID=1061 RepID=UPI001F528C20|nr:FIST N-terminal domain-containing protein [Rhodobacter capsulatus]